MKKITSLLLAMVTAISMTSCNFSATGDSSSAPHVHEFVVTKTQKAYCSKDGYKKLKCSCGETKEEVIPKLGHNVEYYSTTPATCTTPCVVKYKCTRCSYEELEETAPALGHSLSTYIEESRIQYCTNKGCIYNTFTKGNGKYDKAYGVV